MSFEPKTKIELDPPKDDVISLDYLSKCDGELDRSHTGHTCSSDTFVTGTNPDYPTYVAIKGTIFDVTGNKAYGPEGSYKGKLSVTASLQAHQAQLNQPAYSFRRQGCLSRSRAVVSQARGVPCRLVRPIGRAQEGAQRLVHFLQQALQHQRQGRRRHKHMMLAEAF
jgi:hypothetical protein